MAIDNPRLRDRVAERILELAQGSGKLGGRLLSERRLAELLRVSRSTVQQAVKSLRERGLFASRHGSGTYLARRPAKAAAAGRKIERVRVVSPEAGRQWLDGFYYAEIYRGLLAAAKRRAVQVDLVEWTELAAAASGWAESVPAIVMSLDDRVLLSRAAERTGLRPILIDSVIRDLPVTSVVDGCFEGTRQGVRRLAALGHRRIACNACLDWERINPDKMAGYRAGLEDAGLAWDPELVFVTDEEADQVAQAAQQLLSLSVPPTAWFAFNDGRALALVKLLEARGLAVGRDVSVLGHGDTASRKGLCGTLSSVRIPLRRMGERALEEALLADPPVEGKVVIVRDTLVLRESVGSCPGGGMDERGGV